MGEIKEVLLQMLIAGLPAFLFPLTYGKRGPSTGDAEGEIRKYPYAAELLYTCTLSMLLCLIFSTRLWGNIPLHYGILPLFALMLYGRLREGAALGLL
ncbi:PAS domain-containing sensor histidine kinase, partial [Clostridium perfringens]